MTQLLNHAPGGSQFALMFCRALAADPAAIGVSASVQKIVNVTLRAVSFLRVTGAGSHSAQEVNAVGHKFQMIRSDAGRHAAQMVSDARSWLQKMERANQSRSIPEMPVSLCVLGSNPDPTVAEVRGVFGDRSVFVDLRPEALFGAESVTCVKDIADKAGSTSVCCSRLRVAALAVINPIMRSLSKLFLHSKVLLLGAKRTAVTAARPRSILPLLSLETSLCGS